MAWGHPLEGTLRPQDVALPENMKMRRPPSSALRAFGENMAGAASKPLK